MGIVSGRVRKQVYKKCDGRCAYCGKDVPFPSFEVDHLVPTYWKMVEGREQAPFVLGTDHIENLMPSCKRCNKWKSNYHIDEFRAQIVDQHNKLIRDAPGYKLAKDYGMIVEVVWDQKFYYEKMPGFSASHQRVTG